MSRLSTALVRLFVLALSATSAVGQIAYLDALYWRRLGWAPSMGGAIRSETLAVVGTDAVVSLLAAVVALSLVFGRDRERGGRHLAVAVAAWAYLLAYGGVFRLLAPAQESMWRMPFEAHFLLVECLGLAALLGFSSSLPRPLTAADVIPPGKLPVGIRSLHHFRIWLFRPWAPWVGAAVLTVAVLLLAESVGTPLVEAPLNPVMDVARFGTLTAVVINFRSSWDVHGPEGRRHLTWVVLGLSILLASLALLVGGNVLMSVTAWRPPLNWRPIVLNLGLLGLLWSSAMAVFYNGDMNPRALVRRTATLAGLGTALFFLAAGLEALFSDAMVARISLPPGVGSMTAICLFAWVFEPTHRVVENVVDQIWAVSLPEE